MEFLANLHHKVIHFPIAFLMVYPLIEILALTTGKDFFVKSAGVFLQIGTLGSLAAVFTGNQAFTFIKEWQNESLQVFDSHQTFASISVWYFTGLLILRTYLSIKKKLNKKILIVFVILSLIGAYLIFQTANYGGELAKERFRISAIN